MWSNPFEEETITILEVARSYGSGLNRGEKKLSKIGRHFSETESAGPADRQDLISSGKLGGVKILFGERRQPPGGESVEALTKRAEPQNSVVIASDFSTSNWITRY